MISISLSRQSYDMMRLIIDELLLDNILICNCNQT